MNTENKKQEATIEMIIDYVVNSEERTKLYATEINKRLTPAFEIMKLRLLEELKIKDKLSKLENLLNALKLSNKKKKQHRYYYAVSEQRDILSAYNYKSALYAMILQYTAILIVEEHTDRADNNDEIERILNNLDYKSPKSKAL